MRKVIAYVDCLACELNGAESHPAMRASFSRDQIGTLIEVLQEAAGSNGREWLILSITGDNLTRWKVLRGVTPNFEMEAAANYLRGDTLRVNTTQKSCNITFSVRLGRTWLVEELRAVHARARNQISLVVPNRWNKKDLIEFIADTDREAEESQEHNRLGEMGAVVAAESWSNEDFSDWEVDDG